MALTTSFICCVCHKEKYEISHFVEPTKYQCQSCYTKELQIKRSIFLNGLQLLSLEERISRIEAWIYDYKPPININDIKY